MTSKMSSARRETKSANIDSAVNPVTKVSKTMLKLRNEIMPLVKSVPYLSQIFGSDVEALFDNMTNTVEHFEKFANATNWDDFLKQLISFSSLGNCISLAKSILNHFQDEVNNDQSDHDERQNRIRVILDEVDAKLKVIDIQAEELGRYLLNTLHQNDQNEAHLIDFNHRFDLIVVDLDSCAARLATAKIHLVEGFGSIKAFEIKSVVSSASQGFGAVAGPASITRAAFRFAPVIGRFGAIGLASAAVIVGSVSLWPIATKLIGKLKRAKDNRKRYKQLNAEMQNLECKMDDLRRKMEVHRNAKLARDQDVEIQRLRERLQMLESVRGST